MLYRKSLQNVIAMPEGPTSASSVEPKKTSLCLRLTMLVFFLKEQPFLAGRILLSVGVGNMVFGRWCPRKLRSGLGSGLIYNRYICGVFGIRKRKDFFEG